MAPTNDSRPNAESPLADVRVIGLGVAEIWLGQQRITPRTDVLFALLLILTDQYPRPTPATGVLDLLWPNIADPLRRHALRQLVYRVRRLGCPVSTDHSGLLLQARTLTSDVLRLRSKEWRATASRVEVQDALSLFPGYAPTFSSPFADWLDRLRSDAATLARDVCLEELRVAKYQGKWLEVEDWAQRCLVTDSLNEEATLARAEALAMRGSKTEALGVLSQYMRELGPSASTLALPAKLLRHRISEIEEPGASEVFTSTFGREREFSMLVESATKAKRGGCVAAMVHGASGSGKTTLLGLFSTFCETQGFASVRIRAVADLHGSTLALLSAVLTSAIQLPGALACSPEHLALLRAVAASPSASAAHPGLTLDSSQFSEIVSDATVAIFSELETENPVLLVIDDYGVGDSASLLILTRVAAAMTDRRFMMVVSSRSHPRNAPLLAAFQSVRDLHLGDLSREALAQVVQSSTAELKSRLSERELDNLYAATGGHPLFIREMLGTGFTARQDDIISPTLEGIIWGRVSDVSLAAQRLMHQLAVLHSDTNCDGLLTPSDFADPILNDLLSELTAAGLIPTSGHAHLKPYPPVSTAIRNRLSPAVTSSLHFRVGCLIERKAICSDSPEYAREGARHLALGREGDRAASLLRAASLRQLAIGNSTVAADLLSGAAKCAQSDRTKLLCIVEEIQARRLTGDWERASALCNEISLDTRKRLLSSSDLLDVYLTSLEADLHRGDNPELTLSRMACVMKERQYPIERRERAANLTAILASNCANTGALADAVATLATERVPESPISFDGQLVHIIAEHDLGTLANARVLTSALVSRARVTGSAEQLVRSLLAASVPERSTGAHDATVSLLREAFAESDAHQLWSLATRCADTLSGVYFDAEDLAQAQHWQEAADARCKSLFSHWTNRTVVHQRLRLSAHRNPAGTVDPTFVGEYANIVLNDQITVRRNHDLAVLTMLALQRKDHQRLHRYVDELLAGLDQCQGQHRVDYMLAAAICGARAIGARFTTTRETTAFCRKHRKSPFAHLWYLEASLSGDLARLFPATA